VAGLSPTFPSRADATQFSQWERPAPLGLSIGHPKGTRGSIGPFVILPNGRRGFVSTATVLAPPGAHPGDHIHQPSPRDDYTLTGTTRIGILSHFVSQPRHDISNEFDAAVVELLDESDCDGNVVPSPSPDARQRISAVVDPNDELLGAEVACVGLTSGLSNGIISAVGMTMTVAGTGRNSFSFVNCIEVWGLIGPSVFQAMVEP